MSSLREHGPWNGGPLEGETGVILSWSGFRVDLRYHPPLEVSIDKHEFLLETAWTLRMEGCERETGMILN